MIRREKLFKFSNALIIKKKLNNNPNNTNNKNLKIQKKFTKLNNFSFFFFSLKFF